MARVELRMRTFIPYDHIPSPTNSNQRFLGDVRKSAIWGSSAYRTSQSWIVDTSSSTNFITAASKNTGITYKQRYENGKWVTRWEDQAPLGGLSYSAYTNNGDVYIRCKCNSRNPLYLAAPAIDYLFTIKVSNAGSVRITGNHDGFPAYELMRRNYTRGTTPETIYLYMPKSKEDAWKLFPNMDISVDKSVTVK